MVLFESDGAFVADPLMRDFLWQPVQGYADYWYVSLVKR
jgi:hypothetical protein